MALPEAYAATRSRGYTTEFEASPQIGRTYMDRHTMKIRTEEQDEEIYALREQMRQKDEQKKRGVEDLIAYYYKNGR